VSGAEPRPRLILASASPRRRLLLVQAGYAIEVDPSGIDEPEPTGPVEPAIYAANLAWRKAADVAARHDRGLILAADTVCAVGQEILNKPADRDDAERMIRLQEGRDTLVVTALCLHRADRPEWLMAHESSVVRFRPLSDTERTAHLDSGKWAGKAGAYGLQDDDPFVSIVSGSWSGVVGLPMERLAHLLAAYPHIAQDGPA
jgi:septum formation protein